MNDDMLEALAEQVHISWMAEKQAQGFAAHPYVAWCSQCEAPITGVHCGKDGCGFPESKHHDDIRPYADLAESVKEYDRATVRAVLRALDAAGLQIVQATTSKAAPR